jgi:hypothetical protein
MQIGQFEDIAAETDERKKCNQRHDCSPVAETYQFPSTDEAHRICSVVSVCEAACTGRACGSHGFDVLFMLSHAVAAGESTSLLTCLIEIAANRLEHPSSFDLRALP